MSNHKHKPIYSVMDFNELEHHVEVEWSIESYCEDEAYACIDSIWSLSESRELFEGEITPKSLLKLQEKLDDIAMSRARDEWEAIQEAREFDRAKGWAPRYGY